MNEGDIALRDAGLKRTELIRDVVGRPKRWGRVGKSGRFEARELVCRMGGVSSAFLVVDTSVSLKHFRRDTLILPVWLGSIVRRLANAVHW